jgi:hypothetical protein
MDHGDLIYTRIAIAPIIRVENKCLSEALPDAESIGVPAWNLRRQFNVQAIGLLMERERTVDAKQGYGIHLGRPLRTA